MTPNEFQLAVEDFTKSFLLDMNELAETMEVPRIVLAITLEGGLGEGIKIEYKATRGAYSVYEGAKGTNLTSVLREAGRRFGFEQENSVRRISLQEAQEPQAAPSPTDHDFLDDEIPF